MCDPDLTNVHSGNLNPACIEAELCEWKVMYRVS